MNTIIKLAPGNIGWFDPLTSIHLTLAKTEAIVKPGMNTTNIKTGLAEGKLILKQGVLENSRQLNSETILIEKTKQKNVVTTKNNTEKEVKKKAKSKTKKTNK